MVHCAFDILQSGTAGCDEIAAECCCWCEYCRVMWRPGSLTPAVLPSLPRSNTLYVDYLAVVYVQGDKMSRVALNIQ